MSRTTRMTLIVVLVIGFVMAGAAMANLTLPYEGSVSEPGEAFRVNNTYAGSTTSYGGYFSTSGAQGRGVYGRVQSTVADVNSYGGFFYADSPKGRGVFGQSAGAQEGIGVKGWASNSGNVANYGGHFCASGRQGIGVYGWAEHTGNVRNYGGYFLAEGQRGVGLFAMGGPEGYAGRFDGDIQIQGSGNGIRFPDGSRQTTAAAGGDSPWKLSGSNTYYSNGNVGIGTTSPDEKLTVEGTIKASVSTNSPNRWAILAEASGNYLEGIRSSASGYRSRGIQVDNTGLEGHGVEGGASGEHGVGVSGSASGDFGVGVSGSAVGAGGIGVKGSAGFGGFDFVATGDGIDYGSLSSVRWKTDIRPIDDPLEKVTGLRGVCFNWDAEHGGRHDIGMIAEEVGELLPEVVLYEDDGEFATGMDYGKLTPLLVEAIKELKAENDALKQRLDDLEMRMQQGEPTDVNGLRDAIK